VPEGGGVFASFGNFPAINDAGQVAFVATLRGTPFGTSDDRGLYLSDPVQGLVKLVREHDLLDGRHVQEFAALVTPDFGGWRSMSQGGDVVARVRFTEPGGDGIYLFHLTGTASAPPLPPPATRLSLRIGPNPIGGGALAVSWQVAAAQASRARVTVLDPTGRLIRVLHDGPAAGAARWDLTAASGRPVAAGVYIVCVEAGGEVRARRVAVTR